MAKVCLTLICPSAAEEQLRDLLLLTKDAGIFTTSEVFGHGFRASRLGISEQVMGRAREVDFTLLLDSVIAQTLLSELRARMPRTGLRYWLSPVLEGGEIK